MIKELLRKILPAWLRAARRNCGGYNRETELFGGYIAEVGAGEELWERRLNALIFANGVRKSTRIHRNAPILEELISKGTLQWDASAINILDIGASAGLDALGNLQAILNYVPVNQYVLGDLHTELHYDKMNRRVFDQDGKVVQQLFDDHFVNLNFEFKYAVEPLFHLVNILRTRRLRRKLLSARPHPEHTVTLSLVYPTVADSPVFSVRRVDVFEPISEKYDLIICMNLLQRRYFNEEKVLLGNSNLQKALTPGGFLLTGVTDNWQILAQKDSG